MRDNLCPLNLRLAALSLALRQSAELGSEGEPTTCLCCIVPPELALDWQFNPRSTGSFMMCVNRRPAAIYSIELTGILYHQGSVSFPLQFSCTYPFSPLSKACRFCLYTAFERQFQQFPDGFNHLIVKTNCKNFPCCGQGQEELVNAAPPQLPKQCLPKFSLWTRGQQQIRYTLQTSILCMFQDHLFLTAVNGLNQSCYGMMCSSEILVEHHLC